MYVCLKHFGKSNA